MKELEDSSKQLWNIPEHRESLTSRSAEVIRVRYLFSIDQ